MTIHKLSAGSGYDYLTRQVARHDATETGHTGLSSYYSAKGEAPGLWIGSGMAGIDGLAEGDVVTAEQMALLFGAGRHPAGPELAARLLDGTDATERDYDRAGRLGTPFPVYARGDVSQFRIEVARRFDAHNRALGLPADHPVPIQDRARIRSEVAQVMFRQEYGRDAADDREVAGMIAKHSRPKSTAVAGYDLTFSPVKSVSTLWAVAAPPLAARIERAHQAAVKDALAFIEDRALFTRIGKAGIQQVHTRGLVATAFTHRDSRAGDPDLHTHVAVANKVQTHDGRWLSIDGRVLFKATVAASETYNTALEKHLAPLGLAFAARPGSDPRKRPIREVVGVNPALNTRWSTRRAHIESRRSELATQFQADHGRPPTPIESIQLAQQATLETRDAKHEPRSLVQQRDTWRGEALQVLGGQARLNDMVSAARSGVATHGRGRRVDQDWVRDTAAQILGTVQASRSTWQVWHVRAEAQRRVRGTDVTATGVTNLVEALTTQALRASITLVPTRADRTTEPDVLRRRDGASVYTVAGANLFTSTTVLSAERRLVDAAGRTGGRVSAPAAVDLALLETAANGVDLNTGQATLVRDMATSGRRLQLAIAPAGAGKTTAMRALTLAWAESGGTVLGLAPSAAAAAALRDQANATTDTLAKLTWALEHQAGGLPDWVDAIGPTTLVLIDEAGMAGTLSLDTAVSFILGRGASVRLIGDDQQLAAIGAGGVLRDIRATHGALHLTELMRFTSPAEGAASLALREGKPEALGFYLDTGRVHVGDLATMTENVFGAWAADRAEGRDAIMLAPTRELAAELNHLARTHRLDGETRVGPTLALSDGNEASVGDLVITRANDRALRMSPTDWVKNGDRWRILAVPGDGTLQVQHARNGRKIDLPARYVRESTELGYATTVHTAQGVTADVMQGLATGDESRQQLYTMLTRGKHANHVYLQVIGDGEEHTLVRPETVHPRTATDLLENILARDASPVSATTMLRDHDHPAHLLGLATGRYHDALYSAAQDRFGEANLHRLDHAAEDLVPGLTDAPAWPTLRAHLTLHAANGADPVNSLGAAIASRELDSAHDPAAVLGWRLDDTGLRNAGPAPLPWIPAVPQTLTDNTTWGEYLTARAALVSTLATEVTQNATNSPTPPWAQHGGPRPTDDLLTHISVWRAAQQIPDTDLRPTGPPQLDKAPALYQRHLREQITGNTDPAIAEFGPLIHDLSPAARADSFAPVLADRLARISRAGINAPGLLRAAADAGPLPDDHAAAALWWRISAHLSPAVATHVDQPRPIDTQWLPDLIQTLGLARVEAMQASPWWPPLVTTLDHALARGWTITNLAGTVPDTTVDVDDAQAMTWRISVLTGPPPDTETSTGTDDELPPEDEPVDPETPSNVASDDEWNDYLNASLLDEPPNSDQAPQLEPEHPTVGSPQSESTGADVRAQLAFAALVRATMGPLEPTDAQIERMVTRAIELEETTTVAPARLAEVNAMAHDYYQHQFTRSGWARAYLTERFGVDVTGHPHIHPGYAPKGWTHLVDHLHAHGVSNTELTESGLAATTRHGRLIDRFRDRALFPILHPPTGHVLGFVGRRNPTLTDDTPHAGPKYLNTPTTALFHKGDQLYGAVPDLLAASATPVLVEGPMDAHAVTLATGGTHIGLAPLGTALTEDQATQLATYRTNPVIATDADLAGRVAAERDHWLLTQHNLVPLMATLPPGADPADLLEKHGPTELTAALNTSLRLADVLVDERLTNLPARVALTEASTVLATDTPQRWDAGCTTIATRLGVTEDQARQALAHAVRAWNQDPRPQVAERLSRACDVRARLEAAATQTPERRWSPIASKLDPRLPQQDDWPALARMMQHLHDTGHNVHSLTRQTITEEPLADPPAQDLRYRLAVIAPPMTSAVAARKSPTRPTGAQHTRHMNHPARSPSPPSLHR
ncbi:MAG: MobF family relaxase [Ornithinimicrobium sp.]